MYFMLTVSRRQSHRIAEISPQMVHPSKYLKQVQFVREIEEERKQPRLTDRTL